MGNGRYPLITMNGYVHGQRGRGRPKKRWIDMIRDDCEAMGTMLSEASRQALDRGGWRRYIVELPMRVSMGLLTGRVGLRLVMITGSRDSERLFVRMMYAVDGMT